MYIQFFCLFYYKNKYFFYKNTLFSNSQNNASFHTYKIMCLVKIEKPFLSKKSLKKGFENTKLPPPQYPFIFTDENANI